MPRNAIVIAILSAVIGGFVGVSFFGGSGTSAPTDPETENANVSHASSSSSSKSSDDDETRSGDSDELAQAENDTEDSSDDSIPDDSDGSTEASDDPRAARANYNAAMTTVTDLSLALASDPETPGRDENIQRLMQALLTNASNDSIALSGVIDEFRTDPTSELGQQLGSLLAEIKDPEVEAMAQELAQSGNPDDMKSGLNLLGGLKIPNEKTLAITQEILRQPTTDHDLLLNALYAMPVMTLPRQETNNVINQLATLAENNPNDGVRSNSLFKISEWAKDANDLQAVVKALDDDSRSPDDRISAAMALAQSPVVDDSLKTTLIARMTDKNELWEIRRYAAEALSRFKLSSTEFQQLEAFKNEQVDLQENG